METKIALVAACDRNNYGDVLMPILFEEYYREHGNGNAFFHYFASSYSDLRNIGGRKTQPVYKITTDFGFVIIAGGEVLTPSYYSMYMNLQTSRVKIYVFHRASQISRSITNWLCKMLLHGENRLPWVIYPKSSAQKVYYNSVGGQNIKFLSDKNKEEIVNLISRCSYISVRDKNTYDGIKLLDKCDKVLLVPDTAIIMSKLYSVDRLREFISSNTNKIKEELGKYYVVQVSNYLGSELVPTLVNVINKIYKEYKYRCLLMPIGRVQGHEDEIPLRNIYAQCEKGASYFLEDNNIYDIMYYIANAISFMGTSLHGVITAAAYYVPHTVISPKCEKTRTFISTWGTSSVNTVRKEEEIISFITDSDIEKTVNKNNIDSMQALVCEHFDELITVIDEDEQINDEKNDQN